VKECVKCPSGALLIFKIILEEEIAHSSVFDLGQDGIDEML
jgi:hypothetical protein